MDEATRSILPQPSAVIGILARQAAIKAVKQSLRDQGRKVSHFTQRDISILADQYLVEHRAELIAETFERVQRSPILFALYEKEQRKRQRQLDRNATNLHKTSGSAQSMA